MKEIPVAHGKVALVDDEDHAWLSRYAWFDAGYGYACGWVNGRQCRMHRVIMGAGPGEAIHHKDGNRLNNQRGNLERMTRSEHTQMHGATFLLSGANTHHRKPSDEERSAARIHKSPTATSHYYGVLWYRKAQKWMVLFSDNGRRIYGGLHVSEEEAARVHDRMARELWGDNAPLNFPK